MGSPKKPVPEDVKVSEPRLPRAGAAQETAPGDRLHNSQRRFRYLAEATSAGIFILDEMIIRYANPAATLLTGYSLDELLGKPFWELADPTYGEVLKRQGLRQFDESIPTRFEIRIITKKGQERWVDLTAGITEHDGRSAIVVTAFDITERDLAEKAMQQAQETANAERQRLNDVLEALPAYLILLTPDYHVSFANRFFRERFGESNGRRCYEYLFNRSEPCENCESYKILSEGLNSYHWEWLGPDGHYYDIHDFPFVDVDGTTLIMEMGIDITERKQAESELQRYQLHLEDRVNERTEELGIANSQLESEIAERQQIEQALLESNQRLALMNEELRRLNRTLKALSSSNQAMLYTVSEIDYLNEVCRIIVEDCGHAMVWIGFAEDDAQTSVRPVASAGFEAGYLEALKISWADNKFGRGPTGTAIRTGKPSRCEDMLNDSRFAPWREQALKRGYASSIVLPLMKGKKAFGALNIYSRQPYGFSDQEEKLLLELTNDLAYGISSIRAEEQRARAEEALVRSEARYRGLFDHMSEGFALHEIICDEDNRPVDYRFIEINDSFERLTGLTRELASGKLVSEVIPNLEPYWVQAYGEVALTGQPIHLENYSEALGRYYDVYVYSPNPRQFATIFTDVTERKQAEARLEYLASFPERNPNPVVEVDYDGHVRYVNPTSRRIFPDLEQKGPAHDWLADWENIVIPFRQGHTDMIVRDVTIGKQTYQQSLNPLLKEGLIRIYGLDITLRKQAESEVLKERLKLQKIFDVVNVGMLLLAPDGSILRANEVAAQWTSKHIPEMVGLQPGDALGCINALNNPQGCGHHANCQVCRIRNSFEAVLQSGQPVHGIETENILYLRGEERDKWLSVSADPIEIDGQQNVILAMNDITPLKEAENALRQAHDLQELRVQKRTEELAITNAQLRTEILARQETQERLEANMQALEVAEEELRENNSALQVAHQKLEAEVIERRRMQEELQASLVELQVIEEELRNNNDILVETQKGLEAEHQRYRDLFEFAPDGYLVTDQYGSVQEANQVIIKLLGISQRHLLKKPLRVFVAPHDYPLYNQLLVELNHKSSIQKREINLVSRQGDLIPAAVTVAPAVNPKGIVSLRWMIRDISELKRVEAQLHLQSTAMQAAANGITITDRDGVIQWCNPAFLEMTGYNESELIGNTLRKIRSGQQSPEYYEEMWQAILSGQIWRGELVNRRKDGRLYTEEQTITPLFNADGEITHFIAVKQDITERKQAELAIRESTARSAVLSEISKSLAEASLDENAILDIVVKTTARMLGDGCVIALASEDSQWLNPAAWYHNQPKAVDLMTALYKSIRQPANAGLAGQVLSTSQTILLQHPVVPGDQHNEIPVYEPYQAFLEQVGISSLLITPLQIGSRTIGTFGLSRDSASQPYSQEDKALVDVLANRTAQAIHNARLYQDLQNALSQEQEVRMQLVQAEKFSVAGRMLASITHEINNPLQTIKNCLYLIRADTSEDTPQADLLGMASSETNRLSNLVAQLRQIYHPSTRDQGQPVDLLALINEVAALLTSHLQEKHVEWQMRMPETEMFTGQTVKGISDQLKQVFLNISLNAADAMQPEGGQLFVDLIMSDDHSQVGVVFKDTGPGIAPEVQDKLFEPFITTKEKGLGLGLVICYDIIRQHNGRIDVHSQPGEGATFTVWLPVTKEEG
jgi:PAS domain S-box-containing protein